MTEPAGDPQITATVVSLAGLLSSQFCGTSEPHAEGLAFGLVSRIDRSADALVIAASTATWAAFGHDPQELPDDAWAITAAYLRSLDDDTVGTALTTFAAAALAVVASTGRTGVPADDLVRAANMARRVEQHTLAAACARAALTHTETLPHDRRVLARLILAVAARNPADIQALYADAALLPSDDPIRATADSLWHSLHPDGHSEYLSAAATAVMADDRRGVATAMTAMLDELKTRYREDDLIRGLHQAFIALSAPELDSDLLRSALPLITRHLRERQRFGELPATARAGVDLLLSALTIAPGSAEATAFIELMDGLADSGLSEFLAGAEPGSTGRGDLIRAEITQGRIASQAVRHHRGRQAEETMAALHGRVTVIFRERKTLNATGFTALHLRPPDGVAIKNRAYPPMLTAGLSVLARQARDGAETLLEDVDVDEMVAFLLPARLQDDIRTGAVTQLTVVPDGDLWLMPWTASALLANVDVRLMPSLPDTAVPAPEPVRSMLAVVDDDAPGADLVVDALHAARARGKLTVTFADDLPDDAGDADSLLFFGHGAGRGLSYGLRTPRGVRTALDLAHSRLPPQCLLAACWSAGSPPAGSQISVPAVLLASGMRQIVGGTWPLPGAETGRVVARAIEHLETGTALPAAVRRAVSELSLSRACRWGITVFGS